MRLALGGVLLTLGLLGCGRDSTGLDGGVPRLGNYSYEFDAGGLEASGTLILTFASEDSIAGRFEVTGFESTFGLGFLNVDAYVVYAYPDQGGIAITRLRPDEDLGLFCEEGRYLVEFGDSRLGSCATKYLGD